MAQTQASVLHKTLTATLLATFVMLGGCGGGADTSNALHGWPGRDPGTDQNSNWNTNQNNNQNTNQNNNQTGGLTIEQYCQGESALEQEWCDYIAQCCTAADTASDVWMFMPHCAYGPQDVQVCIDDINERIAAGKIRYDGAQAQACLDGQASYIAPPPSSCVGLAYAANGHAERYHQVSTQIAACRATFVGLTPQGEECTGASQCVAGTSCMDSGGMYVCLPLQPEYGSCTGHHQCEAGLMCLGDSCTMPGEQYASCESDYECASGLVCRGGTSCGYPLTAGAYCDPASPLDCEPGYLCSYSSSTCVTAAPNGMSCTSFVECLGTCENDVCTAVCGGTWR